MGNTVSSKAGLLTAHVRWGARRMRAPLAPPRLSEPRKVAALPGDFDHGADAQPTGVNGGFGVVDLVGTGVLAVGMGSCQV
jgi:hypothetical protein